MKVRGQCRGHAGSGGVPQLAPAVTTQEQNALCIFTFTSDARQTRQNTIIPIELSRPCTIAIEFIEVPSHKTRDNTLILFQMNSNLHTEIISRASHAE